YRYADANPANWGDPTGLWRQSPQEVEQILAEFDAEQVSAEAYAQAPSPQDILNYPQILNDYTRKEDVGAIIAKARRAGWQFGRLGRGAHKGQGVILRELKNGKLTDRMIEWHPGGGHHGPKSYWKISSGKGGTVRIFGP